MTKSVKKKREVYRDPIYGIAHFHDPGITRIMWRHDPSYFVSESMKMIQVRSNQRLKTVQGNRPHLLHTRFNIDTLLLSPLMVLPHFEDMTGFLQQWFSNRDKRKSAAVSSHLKATYAAQERFCDALFLLLQETVRSAPLSTKPLRGIYSWYLERDSVINQSRAVETSLDDIDNIVIELSDGKKLKIPRDTFDSSKQIDPSMFEMENIMKAIYAAPVKPLPDIDNHIELKKKRHKPKVIHQVRPIARPHRPQSDVRPCPEFNYEKLHAQLQDRRKQERELDMIAQKTGEKHRKRVASHLGYQ